MRRQIDPTIKAHLTRGAFYVLLLLLAVCMVPFVLAQRNATKQSMAKLGNALPMPVSHRTLTFEQRVAYQRAIEDVYWRHRIWPKERPDPKPSLDAVMSQAQLENKVADYLRNSRALEDYWQRPITAEQLQAEMDRMAQHTRQPEVLHELFAVLGNDPFVIAECLARPALSEGLVSNLYAYQQRFHGELRERIEADAQPESHTPKLMLSASGGYTLPTISAGPNGCNDDVWTATSTTNVPSARYYHTAVWTGSEMIVWGGADLSSQYNTGGRYIPSTDSWIATSTINAPSARSSHTVVWTGTEMIVWGGLSDNSPFYLNTGGRYNPSMDSWTATSTTKAPSARYDHSTVWTGSEMIIWGGQDFSGPSNTGGRYTPDTDSWTITSTTNAPSGRQAHVAVWTGSEMIVWGGFDGSIDVNTGGRYNPSTNGWSPSSTTNAPDARDRHTAVWTGSEMIIWGGENSGSYFDTGGRYNPAANSWTITSTTNAPAGRDVHTAVWTGSEMIVWGGFGDSGVLDTGGRYNAGTDSWTVTNTSNAPTARINHPAVWSDSEMIVWGGFDGGNALDTGGRYCAQSGPTPTPTPTASASPTATATPTATPTPTAMASPRVTPTPRARPSPRPRP